jgi:quinol-cytochrome oxidoreductase complex cytochrome b subunit
MTPNLIVFLVGLFVVPLILLRWGHGLRRKSPRSRRAFWGAVIGHCIGATLAMVWGMIPPEAWTAAEVGRGFAGLWAMAFFPALGALGGALGVRRSAFGVRD